MTFGREAPGMAFVSAVHLRTRRFISGHCFHPKHSRTRRNLLILNSQLAALNGRQRASTCLFHDHPAQQLAE